MIRITADKEKATIEIDGVTYCEAYMELKVLLHSIKNDKILGKMYPLVEHVEENNAKNYTSN